MIACSTHWRLEWSHIYSNVHTHMRTQSHEFSSLWFALQIYKLFLLFWAKYENPRTEAIQKSNTFSYVLMCVWNRREEKWTKKSHLPHERTKKNSFLVVVVVFFVFDFFPFSDFSKIYIYVHKSPCARENTRANTHMHTLNNRYYGVYKNETEIVTTSNNADIQKLMLLFFRFFGSSSRLFSSSFIDIACRVHGAQQFLIDNNEIHWRLNEEIRCGPLIDFYCHNLYVYNYMQHTNTPTRRFYLNSAIRTWSAERKTHFSPHTLSHTQLGRRNGGQKQKKKEIQVWFFDSTFRRCM